MNPHQQNSAGDARAALWRVLRYTPALAAGIAVATWLTPAKGKGEFPPASLEAASLPEMQRAGAEKRNKDGVAFPVADSGSAPSIQVSIPGESVKDEFQRMLRELAQAPGDERTERLFLLVARLQRGGAESTQVIREFLNSGGDLSPVEMAGKDAAFNTSGRYFSSFRMTLMAVLFELNREDRAGTLESARFIMTGARNLLEATTAIVEARRADANALHDEAIEAMRRLAGTRAPYVLPDVMSLIVSMRADDLVPIYAAEIERAPYCGDVEALLSALWSFPEETRKQMTQRMIDSEAVRKAMSESPSSWQWLDFREPDYRSVVVEDFRQLKNEEYRMYFLRNLADGNHSRTSGPNEPGTPGSRGQADARLTMLDELEPYCTTPYLQQHLVESRKKLTATP